MVVSAETPPTRPPPTVNSYDKLQAGTSSSQKSEYTIPNFYAASPVGINTEHIYVNSSMARKTAQKGAPPEIYGTAQEIGKNSPKEIFSASAVYETIIPPKMVEEIYVNGPVYASVQNSNKTANKVAPLVIEKNLPKEIFSASAVYETIIPLKMVEEIYVNGPVYASVQSKNKTANKVGPQVDGTPYSPVPCAHLSSVLRAHPS